MEIDLSLKYSFDIELKLSNDEFIDINEDCSKDIDISLEENILPLNLSIKISEELELFIDEGSGGILPRYEGEYNVIPKIKSQKLNTKNKSMTDDVTVEKIPYEEVHNVTGITVTIGGIL